VPEEDDGQRVSSISGGNGFQKRIDEHGGAGFGQRAFFAPDSRFRLRKMAWRKDKDFAWFDGRAGGAPGHRQTTLALENINQMAFSL
jgi:hypothetical protein